MGKLGGTFLRLLQTFLYAIEFCCAAIILGIYSYFLAVLADRDIPIAAWKKAVEGMSGAAVLYLIFAVLLTCFLGGKSFFAFIAIVLDVLFCGAFIAIAVLTRDGAHSCSGNVNTPLGNGPSNSGAEGYGENGFGFGDNTNATYAPNLGLACRLNKACFAVSIIAAILFLISALVQVLLARHHKKEKAYGPSPSNNYTSGSGNRFFRRKTKTAPHVDKDAELGTLGTGAAAGGLAAHHHHEHDVRPSHETGYTGSTVAAPTGTHIGHKHEPTPAVPITTHGHQTYTGATHELPIGQEPIIPTTTGSHAYHTAPTGTAVNPYGYDNTNRGTNF